MNNTTIPPATSCPRCHRSGMVTHPIRNAERVITGTQSIPCGMCNGSGYVTDTGHDEATCLHADHDVWLLRTVDEESADDHYATVSIITAAPGVTADHVSAALSVRHHCGHQHDCCGCVHEEQATATDYTFHYQTDRPMFVLVTRYMRNL